MSPSAGKSFGLLAPGKRTAAKLNNLRPYYYFKHLLTELPTLCDEDGNIEPAKLDYLLPWSEQLSDECRKPRRCKAALLYWGA